MYLNHKRRPCLDFFLNTSYLWSLISHIKFMLTKQFIHRVKNARLPYYLTYEDIETPPSIYSGESNLIHQIKYLFWTSFSMDIINNEFTPDPFATLQNLETIKSLQPDVRSSFALKSSSARVKALVKDFVANDKFSISLAKKKIKSSSLERILPTDLCKFYKHNYLLKKTKQIVFIL